jgi:hypothetical protein
MRLAVAGLLAVFACSSAQAAEVVLEQLAPGR